MAMFTCPGCGLPRAQSVEEKPCPICAADAAAHPATERATQPVSDSFTNLPTDISQLPHAHADRGRGHRPEIVTAILGAVFGAGMVLAVSPFLEPKRDPSAISTTPNLVTPVSPPSQELVSVTPPERVAMSVVGDVSPRIAPMPRPSHVKALAAAPAPRAVPGDSPRPALIVTIDIDQPNGTYSISKSDIVPGQTVILRGRVKKFRTYTQPGITLDASQLVAEEIQVSGYVMGKSVLKLNAPKGIVTFSGGILGQSLVEVNTREGTVYFSSNGSNISGGAHVVVSAARLRCKGEITGQQTHVDLTLSNGGVITAKAILGPVRLQYRKSSPEDLPPVLEVLTIDPKAMIQRVD